MFWKKVVDELGTLGEYEKIIKRLVRIEVGLPKSCSRCDDLSKQVNSYRNETLETIQTQWLPDKRSHHKKKVTK
jgi:hypothetical protein